MLKAKAGNLCMSDAVPFGQHWNYHADHSVAHMLAPGYFSALRHMLRPGDSLRLTRLENHRVREVLDCIVVAVGDDVELFPRSDVIVVPLPEEPKPEPEVRETYVTADCEVKHKGRGKWAVIHPEKGEIAVVDGKEAAEEIAKGNVPVPEAA